MEYDLEKRLHQFSINLICLLKTVKIKIINENIIRQLLKSWTSIWANYNEANWASSRKDFRNKIYICKKESQETEYWINLLLNINEQKIKI